MAAVSIVECKQRDDKVKDKQTGPAEEQLSNTATHEHGGKDSSVANDKHPVLSLGKQPSRTLTGELHQEGNSGGDFANTDRTKTEEAAGIHVSGIPPLPDNFWGRSDIIESVLKQIHKKSHRVITLVGPPGFGKTSIAVAVSKRLQDEGKTQLVFVSLRGVHDLDRVVSKIIDTLLPTTDDMHKKTTLTDLLKKIWKHCLIVLDNAEDCLDVAPTDRESILAAFTSEVKKMIDCNDRIKVLITSRLKVQTIGFRASENVVSCLAEEDAIGLLNQLSEDISTEHATEIARFCGFVPLAVHIAAGIMQYDDLTATELIEDFKTAGLQAMKPGGTWLDPEKQLLLMINSAVNRMSEDLQQAFFDLSLFPGSFSPEAAVAVVDARNTVHLKKAFCPELRQRCLLDYDPTSRRYSMQPLLSKFGRENCPPPEKKAVCQRFSRFFLADLLRKTKQCPSLEQMLQQIHFVSWEVENICLALNYSDHLNRGELRDLKPLARFMPRYLDSKPALRFVQKCQSVGADEDTIKCRNDFLIAELNIVFTLQDWPRAAHLVEAIQQNKKYMDMSSVEDLNTLLFAAMVEHAIRVSQTHWSQPDLSCSLHDLIRHICVNVNPADGIPEKMLCFMASLMSRLIHHQCDLSPEVLLVEIMKWLANAFGPSLSTPTPVPFFSPPGSTHASSDMSSIYHRNAIDYLCNVLNMFWADSLMSVLFDSESKTPGTNSLLEVYRVHKHLSSQLVNAPIMANCALPVLSTLSQAHTVVSDVRGSCFCRMMEDTYFRRIRLSDTLGVCFRMTPAGRINAVAGLGGSNIHDNQEHLREAVSCLSNHEIHYISMISEHMHVGRSHQVLANVIKEVQPSYASSPKLEIIPVCSVPFDASGMNEFAILQAVSTDAAKSHMSTEDLCIMFKLFPITKCCASCLAFDRKQTLHTCKSCGVVKYCSRPCQKNHFKQHKKWCAQLNALRRDGRLSLNCEVIL